MEEINSFRCKDDINRTVFKACTGTFNFLYGRYDIFYEAKNNDGYFLQMHTECPKIYRKFVLHLLK